jgi:hypothetical protein
LEKSVRFALSLGWPAALLACNYALADARPTVIELYTAEGCSSCPPAEELLGTVSDRANVIALALHVDYWDGGGWVDRYALRASTQRQNEYARTLGRSSVVTPEFVIDGARDVEGTKQSAIMEAAKETADGIPIELSVANARLRVALGAGAVDGPCEVTLFAYLPHTLEAIKKGENAGRKLDEFNIVRAIVKLDDWNGQPKNLDVPLGKLPPDATHMAVVVQRKGPGRVVGAAQIALR